MATEWKPQKLVLHNGKTAKIRWLKDLKDAGRSVSGLMIEYTDGRVEIKVNTSKHMGYQARSLLHEILHLALTPVCQVNHDENIEETIVSTLDENLTEIWKLNPRVFLWIGQHLPSK